MRRPWPNAAGFTLIRSSSRVRKPGIWFSALLATSSAGIPSVNCLLSWQGYAPAGPTILRSRSLNPMELPPGIWPPQYVFTAWRRNKSWGGHCLFGSPARTLPAKSKQSRYPISEDALDMKTLPDHLRKGMKLVIVGCNPTESSVRTGHYYSGRGNPFWPVLFETGVIPEPLEYRDDKRIIEFAIGLTDLVKRPTRTVEELTREDYAEGTVVRRKGVCAAGDGLPTFAKSERSSAALPKACRAHQKSRRFPGCEASLAGRAHCGGSHEQSAHCGYSKPSSA